jgi:hypothetical protein
MNTISLKFDFTKQELYAVCTLKLEYSVNSLRFSLSDKMSIDRVDTDAPVVFTKIRDWQPTFADHCNEYEITGHFHTQTIAYHGKPWGWCNIIEERRVAVSSYSSWFPFGDDLQGDWLITLEGMSDYTVINGDYDKESKTWFYGGKRYDVGNIIALKTDLWNSIGDGEFSFWYYNKKEQSFADVFAETYRHIVNYYNSIYSPKDLKKFSLVSLDTPIRAGAYFRKGIVIFDRLPELDSVDLNREFAVRMLGHEFAHSWFNADTNTWEDWLNETGAEWSCLLFVLEHFGEGLFNEMMESRLKSYETTPPIHPVGTDKRPSEGVHDRGVVLFNFISKRFGYDTVKRILQLRTVLPVLTTADLLTAMRNDMSREVVEAADIIERNLTESRYEGNEAST